MLRSRYETTSAFLVVLLRHLMPLIRSKRHGYFVTAAYGACIAGALLKTDYLAAIEAAGFANVAVVGVA